MKQQESHEEAKPFRASDGGISLAAKTGGLNATPPLVNCCKEIIMLRSIGSVTFLALLMVGCGGGDSSSSPPPPPQPRTRSAARSPALAARAWY